MNQEDTIRLIEAYRAKDVLWNPMHRNYYNRATKKDAWDELAEELGRPADELKKKIEYLQSALRRERQKMAKSKTTGQGTDAVYKSSWFYYTHMMFLLDKNKPRDRISTEDSTNADDTESESESLAAISSQESENMPMSPSRTESETEIFTTPPVPAKKARKRNVQKDPVTEALELMRSSAQAAAAATGPTPPDSYTTYANYLASKFRTYSRRTYTTVEHKINNILYCADSGEYEWEMESRCHSRASTPESVSLLRQRIVNSESSVQNLLLSSGNDDSVTQDLSEFITFNDTD